MKKYILLLLCIIILSVSATISIAATTKQGGFIDHPTKTRGGFSGPSIALSIVKDTLTMQENTPVLLRGNIIQHLGKYNYLFQDTSGTIRVEIDHDKWQGQIITPKDTVEIYGEIDKDWNSIEVEVDKIVKLP